MALLKPFTDACGNEFEQAHFRAVQINISAVDKAVNVVFYAYKDLAAFAAGLQPLPGGVKSYSITGQDFGALATAAPHGNTLYEVLADAAETYAMNKADTEVVVDGVKTMVSYFANATRI